MSIDVSRLSGRASLLAALLMVPVPVAVGQDPVTAAESKATTDAASAEGKTSLVTPATSLSSCVQGKLAGWKISVPPRAGFGAKVAVNLKGKS